MPPQSIHLFANPTAGLQKGPAAIDKLAGLLRERIPGSELRVAVPRSVESMREALADAVASEPDVLVVAGGDGTQRLAAEALVHGSGSTILAPWRCGTGNGLADALALPRRLGPFAELLTAPKPRTLRLRIATTDRGPLLHTLGAGLDAAMVHRLSRSTFRLPQRLAWGLPALAELVSSQRHRVRLRIDGEVLGEFEQVLTPRFANHGGVLHLPGPIGRDPERLDVLAFRRRSRLGWLGVALRGVCRRLRIDRDFELHSGSEIELESGSEATPIHLDGDPGGTTPIRISLSDRHLLLLLGQTDALIGR